MLCENTHKIQNVRLVFASVRCNSVNFYKSETNEFKKKNWAKSDDMNLFSFEDRPEFSRSRGDNSDEKFCLIQSLAFRYYI